MITTVTYIALSTAVSVVRYPMPPKMAVYISYIDEMGSPVYNRNDLDGEVHFLIKSCICPTYVGMNRGVKLDRTAMVMKHPTWVGMNLAR